MFKILNTTELQKQLCKILKNLSKKPYIIINHGHPKAILLPYFEGAEEAIKDYFRDYKTYEDQPELKNRFQEALDSGMSRIKDNHFYFTNYAVKRMDEVFESPHGIGGTLHYKVQGKYYEKNLKPLKRVEPATHKLNVGIHGLFLKKEAKDHYVVLDVEKIENPTYN